MIEIRHMKAAKRIAAVHLAGCCGGTGGPNCCGGCFPEEPDPESRQAASCLQLEVSHLTTLDIKACLQKKRVRLGYGWKKLPKGWTDASVDKFWSKLKGKHKVTECIEKMEKHLGDGAGGFCAGLADMAEGPEWRNKSRKKKKAAEELVQKYLGLKDV
jgi:hypothetical protein